MSLITKGMVRSWFEHWGISTVILLVVGGPAALSLGRVGWIIGAVAAWFFYFSREECNLESETREGFPAVLTRTALRRVSAQAWIDHVGDLAGATLNLTVILISVLT